MGNMLQCDKQKMGESYMRKHILWIIVLVLISGCSNLERFQVFLENENAVSLSVYEYKPFTSSTLPELRFELTSSSDIKDVYKFLIEAEYNGYTIESKRLFNDPHLFDATLLCKGDKNSASQILILLENDNVYITTLFTRTQHDQAFRMFKIQEKDAQKFKSILELNDLN